MAGWWPTFNPLPSNTNIRLLEFLNPCRNPSKTQIKQILQILKDKILDKVSGFEWLAGVWVYIVTDKLNLGCLILVNVK